MREWAEYGAIPSTQKDPYKCNQTPVHTQFPYLYFWQKWNRVKEVKHSPVAFELSLGPKQIYSWFRKVSELRHFVAEASRVSGFFKHFDGWSRVVFFHSEVLSLWRKTKTGLVKFSPDGRAQHLVAPHSTGWEVNLGNCKYDGTSWSICLCSCESQILAVLGTIKASPLHHRFAVWIAAHKTWCQLLGTVSAYIEGHHKANHPDAEHNEERQKPHWPKSMVHWKESNPLKPLTTERNNYDNDIT